VNDSGSFDIISNADSSSSGLMVPVICQWISPFLIMKNVGTALTFQRDMASKLGSMSTG